MRKLNSGVYYVDYKNIHTFLDHASEYGWNWDSRVDVEIELDDHTTTKSIIPFSLDYDGKRIGYWSELICENQSDVLKEIEYWDDWKWTYEHIEYYQPKRIIL